MPQNGTIYRILIASPSDVVNERKAIPEVIFSWNAVNSLSRGVILEPVLWETHSVPEMGDRPQAILNKQIVEQSDILIATFWTRLGTSTGKTESGTIEEIEEFQKAGKPVLLYFSSIPVVPESVDVEQYKKVIEFKEKCKRNSIFQTYESISDLREKLQKHITSIINSLHKSDFYPKDNRTEKVDSLGMYKIQFESFLRRLEADWVSERDSEPHNIEEGKLILRNGIPEIIDFKANPNIQENTDILALFDDILMQIKTIQKHQLYIDGGQSYGKFWVNGNNVLNTLKKIQSRLDTVYKEISDNQE